MEDLIPFCGFTDAPVFDFWWRLLWVSKPEWSSLFTLDGGEHVICSLRFTSGATPDDLLAIMTAKSFPSTYLQTSIGGFENVIYRPAVQFSVPITVYHVGELYLLANLQIQIKTV